MGEDSVRTRSSCSAHRREHARHVAQSIPEAKGNALELPRPKWLLDFDAERHAYDVYEDTAKEIREKGYQLPVLPPDRPVDDED